VSCTMSFGPGTKAGTEVPALRRRFARWYPSFPRCRAQRTSALPLQPGGRSPPSDCGNFSSRFGVEDGRQIVPTISSQPLSRIDGEGSQRGLRP